jgi:hypothetical protein
VESGICDRLDAYDGKAIRATNPPGFITDELVEAVGKVLAAGKGKILVDGEEDLAALVVLMRAKDGAFVAYGQPNEGVVLIEVDAVVRKRAAAIFAKMKEIER